MEELFAGFISGYLMAVIFTWLAVVIIVRARKRFPALAVSISASHSPWLLAVPISFFSFLLWTAAGMILGLLYRGAEANQPQGGLGSPNLFFTTIIIIFSSASLAILHVPLRRLYWPLIAFFMSLAAAFGWMLPHLAERA